MKKQVIILLGTLGMVYAAHGKTIDGPGKFSNETINEPLEVMGPITAKNLKARGIEGYGPAKFTESTVDGKLTVQGPLTADKLTAKDIDVYGPAKFTESTVDGKLTVRGPLTAKKSTFKGWVQVSGGITATDSIFEDDITVTGRGVDIDLTDTKTKDITVNIEGSGVTTKEPGVFSYLLTTQEPKETRVLLKGKTEVDGSIRFKGGEGIVVKDESAKITGKVFGAKEAN